MRRRDNPVNRPIGWWISRRPTSDGPMGTFRRGGSTFRKMETPENYPAATNLDPEKLPLRRRYHLANRPTENFPLRRRYHLANRPIGWWISRRLTSDGPKGTFRRGDPTLHKKNTPGNYPAATNLEPRKPSETLTTELPSTEA